MATAILQIRKLSKSYPRNGENFFAVNEVDLTLTSGEIVAIVGRSGSGKSTLLNMCAGLLRPTSGEIFIEAQNLLALNDAEMSKFRNETLGYAPQGASLLGNLTALDNVRLPYYLGERRGEKQNEKISATADERANELLEKIGVGNLRNAYPKELSGGEMRRVALARALLHPPKLLIADEPTGDLDADATATVLKLFREIADAGAAVLLVTHDADATKNADRCGEMADGKLHIS